MMFSDSRSFEADTILRVMMADLLMYGELPCDTRFLRKERVLIYKTNEVRELSCALIIAQYVLEHDVVQPLVSHWLVRKTIEASSS